ncbi:MAG: hypothetical protein WDZ85_03275 [Candidatus Paceibacterota bacterium]
MNGFTLDIQSFWNLKNTDAESERLWRKLGLAAVRLRQVRCDQDLAQLRHRRKSDARLLTKKEDEYQATLDLIRKKCRDLGYILPVFTIDELCNLIDTDKGTP